MGTGEKVFYEDKIGNMVFEVEKAKLALCMLASYTGVDRGKDDEAVLANNGTLNAGFDIILDHIDNILRISREEPEAEDTPAVSNVSAIPDAILGITGIEEEKEPKKTRGRRKEAS